MVEGERIRKFHSGEDENITKVANRQIQIFSQSLRARKLKSDTHAHTHRHRVLRMGAQLGWEQNKRSNFIGCMRSFCSQFSFSLFFFVSLLKYTFVAHIYLFTPFFFLFFPCFALIGLYAHTHTGIAFKRKFCAIATKRIATRFDRQRN